MYVVDANALVYTKTVRQEFLFNVGGMSIHEGNTIRHTHTYSKMTHK